MRRNTVTTAELAKGYAAYTDADELGRAISAEGRGAVLPTTTVLTTSLHCGATEL
jgi:hypothetical protein